MSDHTVELVELDRRLANDPNGAELKRLTNRLIEGKSRVTMEMDRGVDMTEFARLSVLAQAYDAGIDALPKLWTMLNGQLVQELPR